jgi:dolichol phosphate-mannose biosynthesis regulatory protein
MAPPVVFPADPARHGPFGDTQPFLPADHPVHAVFPDRVWAIRIPALLLIVGLSIVGAFIGLVLVKSAKRRRELTGKRGA